MLETRNTIKSKGSFRIIHRDKNGRIKTIREKDNILVNWGKSWILRAGIYQSTYRIDYIGVGPKPWLASTAYAVNDHVIPTTPNGYLYHCKVAGTSGATEPSWPTAQWSQVVDGTVTWQNHGSTTAAAGNNNLSAAITRQNAVGTQQTTTITNDTMQLVTTFSFTTSYAITESGVFTESGTADNRMLCRQTFTAINVVNGDTLEVTWKIQLY